MQPATGSVAQLRERYRFDDLSSFLALYYESMTSLITRQDFADLTEVYLRRAVDQGVRHVELFFDPQAHTDGESPSNRPRRAADGSQVVQHDHDLTGGLIMCFLRDRPVSEAMDTLARGCAPAG